MKINTLRNLFLRTFLSVIALIGFINVAVVSASAQTDNFRWYHLGDNSNQESFYLDLTSFNDLDFENPTRSIWMKVILQTGSYRILKDKWDCRKKRFSTSVLVTYDSQGRVISNFSYSDDQWKDAPPDSVAERIYKTVCHQQLLPDEVKPLRQNKTKQKSSKTDKNKIKDKFVKVKVDSVNIRESHTMEAIIIGMAERGQVFKLTGERHGGWYEIFINDEKGNVLYSPSNKTINAWIHGNTFEFSENQ